MNSEPGWEEKALGFLLLGFAFFCPISIAPAEAFAYLALAVWVFHVFRRRNGAWLRNPYLLPAALFAAVALFASVRGLRPDVSLDKVHRLLLLFIVVMIPTAFRGRERGGWGTDRHLVLAYLAGATLLGVIDLIRVPIEIFRGVSLYDTGNMRDPQMYLASVCFLAALWLRPSGGGARGLLAAATAVNVLGLVLHFKRGAWLASLLAALLLCGTARRWKILISVLAFALVLLALPVTRERLDMLRNEWSPYQGGRYDLWNRIAPALLAENPSGMGYAATEHGDFMRYGEFIQPSLNHLHNNVLQVALEMGPAGLFIWLFWMGMAFWILFKTARSSARERAPGAWIYLGAWGAFTGLMINGLVEYNFGDSEILMLLSFLMGVSCLGPTQGGGNPGSGA